MAAAAVNTSNTSDTIGKRELCALLGWSRPKLDRRLNVDPHFPVRSRGDRGGGWEFNAGEVQAYLAGGGAEPALPDQAEDIDADGYIVDLAEARSERRVDRVQHRGEVTSRQLRDQADADLKIDRLKRTRGELVEAGVMRQVLETVLVELRTGLLAMPDSLVREFDLSERVRFAMRGKIEGMMRTSVLSLKKQLAVTIDPATPGEPG